ncbi:hypothetical protein [Candidatus Magnetomonas plexicatena]|uniref:hypothetical protein n=1 Tax=Candidatus Magnetomonas plexicatena TaxID=2552947 RepID=UPI0011046D3E|nr:hypothetical protein E2O03_001125 [Nitrospirales bacterium LBB_01]
MKSSMKIILLFAILAAMFAISACSKQEPPAANGAGEYALTVPANVNLLPWYHVPTSNVRKNHMNLLKSGQIPQNACLPCHTEPKNFCNKCHEYVGAPKVSVDKPYNEVLGLEVNKDIPAPDYHMPPNEWRYTHDTYIITGKAKLDECLACHIEPDNFCNKCHLNANIRKIDK